MEGSFKYVGSKKKMRNWKNRYELQNE